MYFQFFLRATHPPREIILAHGVYLSFDSLWPLVSVELAMEVGLRPVGAMFAVGSRLRAEMFYTGQSIFRPITGTC